MDKGNVVYTQDVKLFRYKKEWNPNICKEMDATREYNAKWNKPQPKRQVSHLLVVVVNINTEYKNYMNISFATQF